MSDETELRQDLSDARDQLEAMAGDVERLRAKLAEAYEKSRAHHDEAINQRAARERAEWVVEKLASAMREALTIIDHARRSIRSEEVKAGLLLKAANLLAGTVHDAALSPPVEAGEGSTGSLALVIPPHWTDKQCNACGATWTGEPTSNAPCPNCPATPPETKR